MSERIETRRTIAAPAPDIFAVLCDPQGHVAIDSSGMLQDADGDPVRAAGDSFVVHMDRESLNDYPQLGKYDVTVEITEFEQDRLISWTILGRLRPQIGHIYGYQLEPADDAAATVVTSFYDWSKIDAKSNFVAHPRTVWGSSCRLRDMSWDTPPISSSRSKVRA